MDNRNCFYGIIQPYRPDFITNPRDEENKIMSEHFLYLKDLYHQGKLYLAGPTLVKTEPFGLYIIDTKTIEEARSLMEADPSIKAGIQILKDLRPIYLSLVRGIDNLEP